MIVIPDIHGRSFWKDAVKQVKEDETIVFLGDYIDPYEFEDIYVKEAIDNFKEIVKFKVNSKSKVILLLGNHDIPYFFHKEGVSRYSYKFHEDVEGIFDEYRPYFQLAYETDNTLFTHAGFLKGWAENVLTFYDLEIKPTANSINNLLEEYNPLNMISRERGGRFAYGSCVWADVSEHNYQDENYKYQVFGHTLQLDLRKYYETFKESDISDGDPIITDKYAMLDNRHAYRYDDLTHKIECLK